MTTRNSLSNQKTLVHHLSSRQQQRHATKNFPAAIFQNFFFFAKLRIYQNFSTRDICEDRPQGWQPVFTKNARPSLKKAR